MDTKFLIKSVAFGGVLLTGSVASAWWCNTCGADHQEGTKCNRTGARFCNSCKKVHEAGKACPEVALGVRPAGYRLAQVPYHVTDQQIAQHFGCGALGCGGDDLGYNSDAYDSDGEKDVFRQQGDIFRRSEQLRRAHHDRNAEKQMQLMQNQIDKMNEAQLNRIAGMLSQRSAALGSQLQLNNNGMLSVIHGNNNIRLGNNRPYAEDLQFNQGIGMGCDRRDPYRAQQGFGCGGFGGFGYGCVENEQHNRYQGLGCNEINHNPYQQGLGCGGNFGCDNPYQYGLGCGGNFGCNNNNGNDGYGCNNPYQHGLGCDGGYGCD